MIALLTQRFLGLVVTLLAVSLLILPVFCHAFTELMNALSWLVACLFAPCSTEASAFTSLSVRLLI